MSTSDKKEDQILTENYYKRTHLWKGNKAIKELVKATKIPKKNVIQWLASQALWQVHLPSPRKIIRPHFNITQPNKMHQFDLLYMPGDILYGTKYKYILTGIDVASRFKVVRPLKTKTAKEVCQALEDIYKIRPLKYPEIFQCDNGSEFKGEVTKLFEKHGVKSNEQLLNIIIDLLLLLKGLIKRSLNDCLKLWMPKNWKILKKSQQHGFNNCIIQ